MAGSRASVAMSDEEIQAFLGSQSKVQVATIGKDGAPHLTTLFYAMIDGRITFWTYGRSQKLVNLRRDARITCLVEDGEDYFELRGVSIRGTAQLIEEYDDVAAIGTAVAAVMAKGQDLGELGEQIVAQQTPKRIGVVVVPEKVASWDHRKLG